MRIGVIGSGYVGLVAAACFAEMGNNVICVDIDEHKISNLKKGILPIYEPGLSDLFLDNQKKGTLHFTTSIKESLDVIRKALEDETPHQIKVENSDILVLNNLVKEDGTIDIINDKFLNKKETTDILKSKLDEVFELHLEAWFDNNIPNYLEKYLKKKN